MPLIADAFSSRIRPVLLGRTGAIAAAHPLAVAAGQQMLAAGGTAADALISAQAVLCVIMPDACGLGGDMLALVRGPDAVIEAINGTGAAPMGMTRVSNDGPDSVTVPGIVDAWCTLHRRHGRLPLGTSLAPAIGLARDGMRVSPALARALSAQRARLGRGGAAAWALFGRGQGDLIVQPELAALLHRIAADGALAFYRGDGARAITAAIHARGGTLNEADMAAHRTEVASPIETGWGACTLATQPPMTQGVLLSMAAAGFARLDTLSRDLYDHAAIELTEAAFGYRADAGRGRELLEIALPVDLARASLRGGPRAYLHTAGVAVADADGMVISSLVSVFDDFGSAVFVPELGITLNNRAGGFTHGANAAAPGKRPVHTLAPAILSTPHGVLALATPGADGQVQTLLQVLIAVVREELDLAAAIARPRWRSEEGLLLIEESHPARERLAALGHRVTPLPDGEMRFGAVVGAGYVGDVPLAVADWRRETWAGVA